MPEGAARATRVADKTPPRWLAPFFRQFGRPAGVLGRLALRIMARANREVNAWVVELLEVRSGDDVLDIGCGPGLALELAGRSARSVAGVDVAPTAVAAARRRCPKARIEAAPADALPFPHGEFSRVMTVNSIGFWPDPEAGVREMLRVLRPGGRVAVALRMKVEGVSAIDRRAYGSTPEQIGLLERLLEHVGFVDVGHVAAEPGGELTTVIRAVRPGSEPVGDPLEDPQ